MRLKKTAIVLATTSLMALAACGGGGDDESNDTSAPEASDLAGGDAGSGQNPDAEAPAAEVDGAAEGGTLTMNSSVSPSTLDPTRAYYTDSTGILSDLVTRSLTQYKYDAETDSMVLVPDMATDLGTPNDDLTSWEFTLRDGLKYSNGDPVEAEDVAYAIRRSFAVEELPDGPTYNQTFFKDGADYKGPFATDAELKKRDGYESTWYAGDDYDGVVVDGNTITIEMDRPFGDMPYYASFPAFTAIPESADTNPATYGNDPLATGPYMFDEYTPGKSLSLVQNPEWDPATDTTRHQYVDGWQFNWSQDQTQTEQTILDDQGTAQTTFTYDNVQPANFQDAQSSGGLVTGTQPCTFFSYLDTEKIPDLAVRQAYAWAFPYRAWWRASGNIEGVTRIGATSILPPGTAGRVDYQALEGQDGTVTDAEKSKALLEEAGATGFEIRYPYSTDDPDAVAGAKIIKSGLEEGGFKVTLVASTSDTIRDLLSNNDADINVRPQGWCSDWPSGGSWFPAVWDGDLVGQAGMPNPMNFKEPAVDKEIDSILDNLTGEEANSAWGELDQTIQTEYMPGVAVGYGGVAMLHGSQVGGFSNDSVRGGPTYQNMFITGS